MVPLYVHIVAYGGGEGRWNEDMPLLCLQQLVLPSLKSLSYPKNLNRADMQQTGKASAETLNISHRRTEKDVCTTASIIQPLHHD